MARIGRLVKDTEAGTSSESSKVLNKAMPRFQAKLEVCRPSADVYELSSPSNEEVDGMIH